MRMMQVMDKIMEKRLAANPKLANMPMMRVMAHLAAKRSGSANQAGFDAKRDTATGSTSRPMTPERITDRRMAPVSLTSAAMKKGGKVKKMAKGGKVSSASKRGDGCATKGKTKGRFV